jgi:hypothetical protein
MIPLATPGRSGYNIRIAIPGTPSDAEGGMRAVGPVVAVVAVVLGTAAVCADDQGVIQRIVDKAIKAAGGEAKLKKFRATLWRSHSLVYGPGGVVESSGEYALDTLDHYRSDVTTTDHGRTSRRITVQSGRKCWVNENGMTAAVSRSSSRVSWRATSAWSWRTTRRT